MAIRHIIFDLGGVLLNLNKQANAAAFNKLGATGYKNFINHTVTIHLLNQHEKGMISSSKLREHFKEGLDLEISDEQFDVAYNSLLVNIPKERFALLTKLKEHHSLYLLSNTNEIHFKVIQDMYQRDQGEYDFNSFFVAQYYSHLIHHRKPDETAFQHILNTHHLKPEETLFIDDTYENIATAKELGLHAIHITGEKSISDLVETIEKIQSLEFEKDDSSLLDLVMSLNI